MAAQATNDLTNAVPTGFATPGPPMGTGGPTNETTGFALYASAGQSFVIVAFDPLRGDLAATTDTTLTMDINETPGLLDPDLVSIQVDGVTIYTGASFLGEYTGSSITPQGGGVFRFLLVKATPWPASARVEVRVFLPPETP